MLHGYSEVQIDMSHLCIITAMTIIRKFSIEEGGSIPFLDTQIIGETGENLSITVHRK